MEKQKNILQKSWKKGQENFDGENQGFLYGEVGQIGPPCQFYNTGFIYFKPKLYNYHNEMAMQPAQESVTENFSVQILFIG